MTDDLITRLRDRYEPLLDFRVPTSRERLDIEPDTGVPELTERLTRYFAANARVNSVLVRALDRDVAVSTRARVAEANGFAAGDISSTFSSGERASQPGESTQYHLITYACEDCDGTAIGIFYDERYPCPCPKDASHKAMTLVERWT